MLQAIFVWNVILPRPWLFNIDQIMFHCLIHIIDVRHTNLRLHLTIENSRTWTSFQIRDCREHFPLHRLQMKPLVSDPDKHRGTCVTQVPWCMSGSLTRGGRENVSGIPGACASCNFTYLARGPYYAHVLVMLCFVVVVLLAHGCDVFTLIIQGCSIYVGVIITTIVRLYMCQ